MVLPLLTGESFEGVLCIDYRKKVNFEKREDLKHKADIVRQSAVRVIHNTRLSRELEISKQNISDMSYFLQVVTKVNEMAEILGKELDGLNKELGYEKATIQLIKSNGARELISYRGFCLEDVSEDLLRPIYEDRLIESIIREHQPKVLENTRNNPLWIPEKTTLTTNSWIGFPLFYCEEVIGLLTLEHQKPNYFNESHLSLISPYCNQFSMLIKMYNDALRYEDSINDNYKILQANLNIGEVALIRDKYILAEAVYSQASQLFDTKNFYIANYEASSNKIEFLLAYDKGKQVNMGEGIWSEREFGNGLTEFAIKGKNNLYINKNVGDFLEDNDIEKYGDDIPKSWLGVPMKFKENIVGLICLQDYEKENAYNADMIKGLTNVATQAAQTFSVNLQFQISEEEKKIIDNLMKGLVEINYVLTRDEQISKAIEVFKNHLGCDVAIYTPDNHQTDYLHLHKCKSEIINNMLFDCTMKGISPLKEDFFDEELSYRIVNGDIDGVLEAKFIIFGHKDSIDFVDKIMPFIRHLIEGISVGIRNYRILEEIYNRME
jgi:transcriptional regulator with GAF, ATPase, and Fis domain